MTLKKLLMNVLLIVIASVSGVARSELPALQSFTADSYQQILANNVDQPFILVLWSIDCSSCLKEMKLLHKLHQDRPNLKIITVSVDGLEASDSIRQILGKNQLTDLGNWVFADENIQKLRYKIDPRWYGELPKTYFFNRAQQRTGVSGIISEQNYAAMLSEGGF